MAAAKKQQAQSDFQRINLDDLLAMQEREGVLIDQMSALKEHYHRFVEWCTGCEGIRHRALPAE